MFCAWTPPTIARAILICSPATENTQGTTIRNQVLRLFNGLGQLTAEYQQDDGPVVIGTSPVVFYSYSEMAGGATIAGW